MTRIGSLCSGYGGLDHGVQSVVGGRTAWVSDVDEGARKILAHRYPDAPNLGDFTTTDWSTVEPVDVLTAGFPCQPVSHAGKQLGDQDERWLWDDVARAVCELRPGLVVLENVRGLLTAGSGRLFGRVLGSLADLGYDTRWHGVRAADVAAPHLRFRVFLAATDARRLGGAEALEHDGRGTPADHGAGLPDQPDRDAVRSGPLGVVRLLKTPTSQLAVNGGSQHPDKRKAGGHGPTLADEVEHLDWGTYADAIGRWAEALGRPAPEPMTPSARGNPQLSPVFVEWMMGLEPGWVTDVPGLTRNQALKALGNGVVPQQAAAALRTMMSWKAPR